MKQTALITGASSGIGAELARVAAADNYNLVLAARNGASMRALADELFKKHGTSVTVIEIDLVQPGASAELYRRVNESGLKVDILVNNAGVGYWDYRCKQWAA